MIALVAILAFVLLVALADLLATRARAAEGGGVPPLCGEPRPRRSIYLASSWRNEAQPAVVVALREAGHTVYDFRNPASGSTGFSWRKILPEPPPWSAVMTRSVLADRIAEEGFTLDFEAMQRADTFVMLQPCGRSAALELGWAVGAGKKTVALLVDGQEPELMLKCADKLCVTLEELLAYLEAP